MAIQYKAVTTALCLGIRAGGATANAMWITDGCFFFHYTLPECVSSPNAYWQSRKIGQNPKILIERTISWSWQFGFLSLPMPPHCLPPAGALPAQAGAVSLPGVPLPKGFPSIPKNLCTCLLPCHAQTCPWHIQRGGFAMTAEPQVVAHWGSAGTWWPSLPMEHPSGTGGACPMENPPCRHMPKGHCGDKGTGPCTPVLAQPQQHFRLWPAQMSTQWGAAQWGAFLCPQRRRQERNSPRWAPESSGEWLVATPQGTTGPYTTSMASCRALGCPCDSHKTCPCFPETCLLFGCISHFSE